ncbi:MAG TPA: hypothetical protein VJ065_03175 [Patescibacteria group bacterium]|nr:hypothetical protein [Patescibacteria group bacterium]
MVFDYRELAPGISRPIIPVRLQYKKIFVILEAIIDSGADWCIFDAGLLGILKLPLGPQTKFFGAGKEPLRGFKSKVNLTIIRRDFKAEVLFSPDLGRHSYGILGQKGFFDNFKVCFDKSRNQIDINPK